MYNFCSFVDTFMIWHEKEPQKLIFGSICWFNALQIVKIAWRVLSTFTLITFVRSLSRRLDFEDSLGMGFLKTLHKMLSKSFFFSCSKENLFSVNIRHINGRSPVSLGFVSRFQKKQGRKLILLPTAAGWHQAGAKTQTWPRPNSKYPFYFPGQSYSHFHYIFK